MEGSGRDFTLLHLQACLDMYLIRTAPKIILDRVTIHRVEANNQRLSASCLRTSIVPAKPNQAINA